MRLQLELCSNTEALQGARWLRRRLGVCEERLAMHGLP